MSRRYAAAALLSASCALAFGCARGPEPPGPDIVVRIVGADIPHAEFERYLLSNLGETGGALASEALSSLFDQFVTERLLARLAFERGLAREGQPASEAVEALLAAEPAALVTETAISAFYRENRKEFGVPEQIVLRVIQTDDRITADRARREIVGGGDFAQVARRLSVDPSATEGGDQGSVSRDSLPPQLADMLFRLKEGALSEVVAGDNGFRLFQVVHRVPERVRTLDEVRAEILDRLGGARADRALARFVAEARSRYAVEVFDRNLPFSYKGGFSVSRPYENR